MIPWWDRFVACQCLFFFKGKYFCYVNVVQLTTSLDVVVGGRLGVNFFPPTATSDVAGTPQTGLFLIEVGVIWIGWVTLT